MGASSPRHDGDTVKRSASINQLAHPDSHFARFPLGIGCFENSELPVRFCLVGPCRILKKRRRDVCVTTKMCDIEVRQPCEFGVGKLSSRKDANLIDDRRVYQSCQKLSPATSQICKPIEPYFTTSTEPLCESSSICRDQPCCRNEVVPAIIYVSFVQCLQVGSVDLSQLGVFPCSKGRRLAGQLDRRQIKTFGGYSLG